MERSPAPARCLSQLGISLTEMLIVVTVIGLTAAIVAPKIDIAHYQIDGAMQSIGYTLMSAQREAVSQQHDVIVEFDTVSRILTIHDDDNNNRSVDSTERVRHVVLDNLVRFGRASAPALSVGGAAVTFSQMVSGLPSLTFHRNGSASQEGGIYLTSTRAASGDASRQGDTRAVTIDRPTGRTVWWRYDGTTWHQGF